MFKEKVEKVIEEIQSKNKDLTKFPSLLEVCNPGETNFIPRKVGDGGYVLLCPFKIKSREKVIKEMAPSPLDFMGVSPFMMVIMESGSSNFEAGQIVLIEPRAFESIDQNFLIIKSSVAYLMPDSVIQGVEGDITEMAKRKPIIKTIADA